MISQGSKSLLNYKTETAYGVAPAGNWNEMLFSSETMGTNANPVVSGEISRTRTVRNVRKGNVACGGNIVCDLKLMALAPFFAHLLANPAYTSTAIVTPALAAGVYLRGDLVRSNGNDYICVLGGTITTLGAGLTSTDYSLETHSDGTTTWQYAGATATSKYRHVLTAGVDFPTGGLSIEKQLLGGTDTLITVFKGGRVNSCQITIPQEGLVTSTFDLLFTGQPANPNAAVSGTAVAQADVEGVKGSEADVEVSGIQRTDLQTATLTIPNNIDANTFRVGNQFRKAANPQRREINGSATLFFETRDMYDKFMAETSFALFFSFYHNGNFLSIELPSCKITGDPHPKISGPGNIMLSFNFQALYSASAGYDCQLVLKNQLAAITV